MVPVRLNRRRFLGCSAAAGLALTQGGAEASGSPVPTLRLGLIGAGNRGTALLRSLLELNGTEVVAVVDPEERHASRACGIVEKARGRRPERMDSAARMMARSDVDALVISVPCDLHAPLYRDAIRSGKHCYAEKPLALTISDCRSVIEESEAHPDVIVHVGHQRRSNARLKACAELVLSGDLGELIEARVAWTSSNGPIQGHQGWLGQRERSGDWMIEQAVHLWDVLHWVANDVPCQAYGVGRRDVFHSTHPDRDVTDWYQVGLDWPSGFRASMTHSWIDPAEESFTGITQKLLGTEGGIDLGRGIVTYRDRARPRRVLGPESISDTSDALDEFLTAIRRRNTSSTGRSLNDAAKAVATGLMVRQAVDARQLVRRQEIGESF